jgi:membrane protein YqaA with SNARE-associated domain
MDVLLIILAARNPKIWFYYAAMATVGSVAGGFITYRLARKGGKEAVARKIPQMKADKVYKIFDRWGFGAIAIPALLPPPLPIVPFLLAAGALQYPVTKFLAALSFGRMIRYAALGYLSFRYGRTMLKFVTKFRHPYLIVSIVLIATAATIVFVILQKKRKKSRPT